MSRVKAIETRYKGYRFRSRLEARWAVFFDALGVKYEYEKEGYDLGEHERYLCDFWLPEVNAWFEVKGDQVTDAEHYKAAALARLTEFPVIISEGTPGYDEQNRKSWMPGETYSLTIHYGSPALFARHQLPCSGSDCDVEHSRIVVASAMRDSDWVLRLMDFVLGQGYTLSFSGSNEQMMEALIQADRDYFQKQHQKEHREYVYGLCVKRAFFSHYHHPALWLTDYDMGTVDAKVVGALNRARAARFEFGETPR